MQTAKQSYQMNISGYGFNCERTRQALTPQATEVSELNGKLTMGKSGTLTTRTDNDTGVVTAVGHGLVDGDIVDVYWAGLGNVRYGMTVGTVSGNNVPIDAGTGPNLPTETTPVIICKRTRINAAWADVDGDSIKILIAVMNVRGHVVFREADGTLIDNSELLANEPYEYFSDLPGGSNPFAGVAVSIIDVSAGAITTGAACHRVGAYFGS